MKYCVCLQPNVSKKHSQIINWAAFLQNTKSNKILFSSNKGNQQNNEKSLHFCQSKKYIQGQSPVIFNLFNLKTKVKFRQKTKIYSYIRTISRDWYHSHKQLYKQDMTGKFIIQLINIIKFNTKLLNSIYINFLGINYQCQILQAINSPKISLIICKYSRCR